MSDKAIRILVADDHVIVGDCISQFIDSQEDLTVIGRASDGAEAVEMAGVLRPDVVIMDYSMPRMNGVEATRQIVKDNPGMVVIGFSFFEEDGFRKEMLKAGAAAHVSKSGSSADLLAAIRDHIGYRG